MLLVWYWFDSKIANLQYWISRKYRMFQCNTDLRKIERIIAELEENPATPENDATLAESYQIRFSLLNSRHVLMNYLK